MTCQQLVPSPLLPSSHSHSTKNVEQCLSIGKIGHIIASHAHSLDPANEGFGLRRVVVAAAHGAYVELLLMRKMVSELKVLVWSREPRVGLLAFALNLEVDVGPATAAPGCCKVKHDAQASTLGLTPRLIARSLLLPLSISPSNPNHHPHQDVIPTPIRAISQASWNIFG